MIQVQNGTVSAWADLGIIGSDWSVAQIGDFNGDGISDILWRNTDGATGIDLMSNASVSAWASLGTVTADWSVAKTSSTLSTA